MGPTPAAGQTRGCTDSDVSSCFKLLNPLTVLEAPVKSQCLISFGSNLGNRDCLIAEAARIIAKSPLVDNLRASRLFETPPIGGPQGQEPFLNAVAAFETDHAARQILWLLQETEEKLGRQRKIRWDARSIDLDVVLHGELMGGGTGLIVPHPRYTARQFVLQPACDVASEYRDPRFGWTIDKLAKHLQSGPPSIALNGGSEGLRLQICERLAHEHGIQTFTSIDALESLGTQETDQDLGSKVAESGKESQEISKNGLNSPQDQPWVSSFVPPLESRQEMKPSDDSKPRPPGMTPLLIGRIQSSSPETRWPAPHQMWPSGWNWPEYRLEIDDMDWAVSELVSAIDSMQCPVIPITEDGNWWI